MCYWTGRFEAKHRVSKNFAQAAKNVKNVTKTLSERQQLRAASVFYNGMFDSQPFSLPEHVSNRGSLTSQTSFSQELKSFMGEKDLLCDEVVVNNQVYRNGDLIILAVQDSDQMKVGVIQTILIRNKSVYFVTKSFYCERHWLGFFESKTCDEVCSFTESGRICDYKPLVKRGTMIKFNFVLHHHVSFTYT